MWTYFRLFLLFQAIFLPSNAQNMQLRGQRKRRGDKKANGPTINNDENKLMQAVTINYPLKFFDGSDADWRRKASLNPTFLSQLNTDKSWLEVSRAQDQEDIWLYENWFYGMQNGVIMESGALNGLIFSTSFFFEQVANWTAVHVGKPSTSQSIPLYSLLLMQF